MCEQVFFTRSVVMHRIANFPRVNVQAVLTFFGEAKKN